MEGAKEEETLADGWRGLQIPARARAKAACPTTASCAPIHSTILSSFTRKFPARSSRADLKNGSRRKRSEIGAGGDGRVEKYVACAFLCAKLG